MPCHEKKREKKEGGIHSNSASSDRAASGKSLLTTLWYIHNSVIYPGRLYVTSIEATVIRIPYSKLYICKSILKILDGHCLLTLLACI